MRIIAQDYKTDLQFASGVAIVLSAYMEAFMATLLAKAADAAHVRQGISDRLSRPSLGRFSSWAEPLLWHLRIAFSFS